MCGARIRPRRKNCLQDNGSRQRQRQRQLGGYRRLLLEERDFWWFSSISPISGRLDWDPDNLSIDPSVKASPLTLAFLSG